MIKDGAPDRNLLTRLSQGFAEAYIFQEVECNDLLDVFCVGVLFRTKLDKNRAHLPALPSKSRKPGFW